MLKKRYIFESLAGLGQTTLAVAVQIGYAAVIFFSSMVQKSGMSTDIIVAYRLMFAAAITVTLALIFERLSVSVCVFFPSYFVHVILICF
jgi:hypothetical protein